MISAAVYYQVTVVASATSNQNNNQGLFRWTEKTPYSINALRFCFLFRNVTSEHVYSKTLDRGKLLLLFSMVKKNKQIKVYGWTTVLSNMSWSQMLFLEKALLNIVLSTVTFEHK